MQKPGSPLAWNCCVFLCALLPSLCLQMHPQRLGPNPRPAVHLNTKHLSVRSLLGLLLHLLEASSTSRAGRQWVLLESVGNGKNQRTVVRRPFVSDGSATEVSRQDYAPRKPKTPTLQLLSEAQRSGCLASLVGNKTSPYGVLATTKMVPKVERMLPRAALLLCIALLYIPLLGLAL